MDVCIVYSNVLTVHWTAVDTISPVVTVVAENATPIAAIIIK